MIYSLFYASIPITAYFLLVIILYNHNKENDLRQVTLRAGILFVVYLIALEEVLSLFKGITRIGLIIGWLILILIAGVYIFRVYLKNNSFYLPHLTLPAEWSGRLLLALSTFVLVITFLVAWLSPPQTWDSLSYHLSRVAHWAQNRSVADYVTGIERQISMNPAAEMVTLNFYVLVGSDRLATFTQWFAMLGSMLGVSLIAMHLGAKKYGQWLTLSFAITVPMGIVQASSTITDYFASFWLVCVAAETLYYSKTHKNDGLVYLGLSAGLAALTKATTMPYLLPIAFWAAILVFRWNKPLKALRWGVTIVLLVLFVNAAYFARNYQTYGALYNPVDTGKHLNQLRTIPGTISILIRNMGQQAGISQSSAWNNWVDLNILKVHVKLGVDMQDPRTTNEGVFKVRAPNLQEDGTINPFHAALILISMPLSLLFAKKIGWQGFLYFAVVTAGYILFSFLYKWNVFGVRYQLQFFILMMPFVGLVFSNFGKVNLGIFLAYVLLFTSLPWLFQIASRPLIPNPKDSLSESILVEPRQSLYFANAAGPEGPPYLAFHQMASAIKSQGCNQIGLMLLGDSPEYLFWVVMGAPDDSFHIEWNVAGAPSNKYEPQDFDPCAFVCQGCLEGGRTVRDQNIYLESGGYELFMNPTRP
jgi:hypothetical protein